MSDKTYNLSTLDLSDTSSDRLQSHVKQLAIEDGLLKKIDNKSVETYLGPFAEGGADSVVSYSVSGNQLLQEMSISGTTQLTLERNQATNREVIFTGLGVATSMNSDEVVFTNPFGDGFQITETESDVEISLTGAESGDIVGLGYDNYAAFGHISTVPNSTGFSGGSTSSTSIPLNVTFVNNIPNFAHRPNSDNIVYVQPGKYWVKLSLCGFATDGHVTRIATTGTETGAGGIASLFAVGKMNQDCSGLTEITSPGRIYVLQSRQRGTMTYGGGDTNNFNINLLLEIWKVG